MVKFLKPNKAVILLQGRYAGRKVVIVRALDEGTRDRPYDHCLVAGVSKYPKKVIRKDSAKKQAKKSRVKVDFSSVTSSFMLSEVGIVLGGGETIVSLPKLEAFIHQIPKTVYVGDLQPITLELRNPCEIPVKNLKMKVSRPRFLQIGHSSHKEAMNMEFPVYLEKGTESAENYIQSKTKKASDGVFFVS